MVQANNDLPMNIKKLHWEYYLVDGLRENIPNGASEYSQENQFQIVHNSTIVRDAMIAKIVKEIYDTIL